LDDDSGIIEISVLTILRVRILTHDFLLKEIWGPTHTENTQYLRVFIGQIRKKIEDDLDHPRYIITDSGVGYRMLAVNS
jgi:two-component system KDP operon response regulator KdpE